MRLYEEFIEELKEKVDVGHSPYYISMLDANHYLSKDQKTLVDEAICFGFFKGRDHKDGK